MVALTKYAKSVSKIESKQGTRYTSPVLHYIVDILLPHHQPCNRPASRSAILVRSLYLTVLFNTLPLTSCLPYRACGVGSVYYNLFISNSKSSYPNFRQ